VNKAGFFRPAGGGIACRVNDRVRRINNRTYAVEACSGPLSDPNAGFACGSMVRMLLF